MTSTMMSGTQGRLSLNSRLTATTNARTRPSLNSKINQKLEQIKKTCLRAKQPSEVGDEDE